MLCIFKFLLKVLISYGAFIHQVYLTAKYGSQCVMQSEKIISICMICHLGIEIDENIHIAVIIEAIGQNGSESIQPPHLVLSAQGIQSLDVVFYKMHFLK